MKVRIVSRVFLPEPTAASFMLAAVARAFVRAGHRVEVVTAAAPRGMVDQMIDGVRIRRAPVKRDADGYVRGYASYLSFDVPLLFRLLFRRPTLTFVEPPPTTTAAVRLVSALQRRPYFVDAADLWSDAASQVTSSRLVLHLLRVVERWGMRGARHLFAISPDLVARMREIGIPTPATVTGFGVDASEFHWMPTARSTPSRFVYAGTHSEWHGADIFLEALAIARGTRPDLGIDYYGYGSEREVLIERAARLGLAESVRFHDPVAPAMLNPVLSAAVASLASLKPGAGYDYAFTTKAYSSFAAGCPVLFAGVGPTVAFLEMHPHAGIAVGYDAESVAREMLRLAGEPQDTEARAALGAWAASEFAIDRIADLVVAECEAAMPASRVAGP